MQYLDVQFEVRFTRGGTTASYFLIDRGLFDCRSGFHGDMFPPERLENAIRRIAKDISEPYSLIFAGDEDEWMRVARAQLA